MSLYQRILVPLDGSATAERGLREAVALAREQHAELRLLHVVDETPMLWEMASVAHFREACNFLRQHGEDVVHHAREIADAAGVPVTTRVATLPGGATQLRVADVIVDDAVEAGCDLIVIGTHGRRGFSRMTLGSSAELVARASPLPVLLVRQPDDAGATPRR